MINKLRRRVIIYTVIAVALVLLILMGVINGANYFNKDKQADAILDYLADNNGDFPDRFDWDWRDGDRKYGDRKDKEPRLQDDFLPEDGVGVPPWQDMTEETPFETRFFSVTLKEDGSVRNINTGKIAAISSDEAASMATKAAAGGKTTGYDGNYKYLIREVDGDTLYVFLDCTRDLLAVKSFLKISLLVSLLGLLAISLLVVLLSPRMVKPIAEGYAKQKEFITNAGHELKTPMTVIESCTDVIEMQSGETKWTAGIKEQVKRLSNLTNQMVALSKMDEGSDSLPMENLEFSNLVSESLKEFELAAEIQGKTIDKNIEYNISFRGNEDLLKELISILADNALKYSTGESPIKFSLTSRGKKIVLTEENHAEGLEPGNQNKFFDRFYRGDTSHSSETPGSGIGLSMAQSIVEAHGGTISADSPDGERIIITATF